MSKSKKKVKRPLFLKDQQFAQLQITDAEELERFLGVGREESAAKAPVRAEREGEKLWKTRSRSGICRKAACATAPRRVALMCDAGLGKTTNMQWLHAAISGERGGRQVPFLFLLESASTLEQLRMAFPNSASLLQWMAGQIATAVEDTSGELQRYVQALNKLRVQGRLTLLFSGLDHVMADRVLVENLVRLLDSPFWRRCRVWLSGRPEAFRKWWPYLSERSLWKILRVEPLAAPEGRFFLQRHSGHDWYAAFPIKSRSLLAVPRFLRLIGGILQRKLPRPPANLQEQTEAVRRLELDTPAGVYYRAYFHVGNPAKPDGQGLLAQGLRNPELAKVGLTQGEPLDDDLPERVQRMSLVLGATAFAMLGMNTATDHPEPNWLGVTPGELHRLVGPKLAALGYGTAADYKQDLHRLRQMNNLSLEFLIFNGDLSDSYLVWHDRTVQAFFAAYWAMKYGSPDDLMMLHRWIGMIDLKTGWSSGFYEFWQFAAEMPDGALKQPGKPLRDEDQQRWWQVFAPCYEQSSELSERFSCKEEDEYQLVQHQWVQWHRRMIYHSYAAMKKRSPKTIERWRALWLKLVAGNGDSKQQRVYEEIVEGFRPCPPGSHAGSAPQTFMMGSPESQEDRCGGEVFYRQEKVQPFQLHEFPVTNAQYELFDPLHKKRRDEYSSDDSQPVIYVTFWDAWCFACWTNNRLPTEVEWEYACRAGTTTPFSFGAELNGNQANCDGNYPYGTNEKGPFLRRTSERGIYKANDWQLFDMHGNVWEWCDSRYEAGASLRVLRGGSWIHYARFCRSAYRNRDEPVTRDDYYGFRLAAVPG